MKTGYVVGDAMTTKPVTIGPSLSVRDAAHIMRDKGVGSLLIVDDHHVLLGIVIAEDFVSRVTAEALDPDTTLIKDIMTTKLIDIRPEADVHDAMEIMSAHNIFHLPVRDGHHKLLGFLTFKDVLKIEPALFEILAELAQTRNRPGVKGQEGYCAECGNFAEDLVVVEGKVLCSYCSENA